MSNEFHCVMSSRSRVSEGKCLDVIPADRARRGAHFCTSACHDEYARLRRAELAKRKCRLCGRPVRVQKPETQSHKGEEVLANVRGEHKRMENAE